MGEDEYDPPIIIGRPFLDTIKVIIYIGTGEVHMHFPSEKVRRYFTDPNYIVEDSKQVGKRRNRNQRRQIIKDGWADYEGEVVRSEDVQFKQNYPEETVETTLIFHKGEKSTDSNYNVIIQKLSHHIIIYQLLS